MKKLLNKRGSVLFLVVVVMALLLVAASATYYVVRNQHASVNIHYNSEQSYQTAYSVSYSLKEYFSDYISKISKKEATYEGSLFEKIWTSSIPLTSQDINLSEYGLGEFDITIKNIPERYSVDAEGNETKAFEVTVVAESNGETTTLTQVWTITLSASETEYFTRFLTSTGEDGQGRDVHLGAHTIYGDAYFENDYTSMENVFMQRSFYANGTLSDQGISFANGKDLEMVIGGNYYAETAGYGSTTIGRIYVGGNFYNGYINPKYDGKAINVDAAYILGDFHYNANSGASTGTYFVQQDFYLNGMMGEDTVVYVGGDLYISDKVQGWNCGEIYVAGKVYNYAQASGGSINGQLKQVYCTGEDKVINSSGMLESADAGSGLVTFEGWKNQYVTYQSGIAELITAKMNEKSTEIHDPSSDKKDIFSDWTDVGRYISNSTAKGTYIDWNAEYYFNKTFPDAPTIDFDDNVHNYPKPSEANNWQEIKQTELKDTNGNTVDGYFSKTNVWNYDNPFIAVVRESFKWRTCKQAQSIVAIDATEKEIYVYLDGDGTDEFRFFTQAGSNVIIMGDNPVIFVLPDGKNFTFEDGIFIGHYDLACYFAGVNSLKDLQGHYLDREAAGKKDNIDNIFKIDTDTGLTVFDPAAFGGNTVHNNVFLVSTGYGTTLRFDKQYTFCGYIYTPHMILDYPTNTGALSFIGGLIVGSYVYDSTNSDLVFINPNPMEIVTELMSEANRDFGNIPSFNTSDSETNATIDFEGYR